jgi:hypothetical protein
MLAALHDAGQYVLENLVVPVGASLATVLATAKVTKWRAVAGEIADHDRRAAEINEDFRRWMRDWDRAADVRMREVTQQASAQGVVSSGALHQATGKVYRHVLHEYRDRASTAQREIDALRAAEGRAHVRRRQRCGQRAPELVVPNNCRTLLMQWRERAEDDPSRPELEPRLAELEGRAPGPVGVPAIPSAA